MKMITAEQRTGKCVYELTMIEIMNEYQAINAESGNFIIKAIELDLTESQKKVLDIKCKEYSEYQSELAHEFIKRMIK